MVEMRLMELQADEDRKRLGNYLSGLVHLKTCWQRQNEQKWARRKLASALIAGIAIIACSLFALAAERASLEYQLAGSVGAVIGVFVTVFGWACFYGDLKLLSKPSEECMRNLDMAVSASDTVKRLVAHIQFYKNGVDTRALANELFLLAKNDSAGSYTRLWLDMEDQDSDKANTPDEEVGK